MRAKSDGWRRRRRKRGGGENEKRDRAQWEVKLILIPHGSGALSLTHSLFPLLSLSPPFFFPSRLIAGDAADTFCLPWANSEKSAIAPTPSRPHIAKVRPVLPGSSFFPNSTDRISSSYRIKSFLVVRFTLSNLRPHLDPAPAPRRPPPLLPFVCQRSGHGKRKGDQRRIPLLHLPPRSLHGLAGLFP